MAENSVSIDLELRKDKFEAQLKEATEAVRKQEARLREVYGNEGTSPNGAGRARINASKAALDRRVAALNDLKGGTTNGEAASIKIDQGSATATGRRIASELKGAAKAVGGAIAFQIARDALKYQYWKDYKPGGNNADLELKHNIADSALSGAMGGAAMGAFAGPGGAVAGAVIGAVYSGVTKGFTELLSRSKGAEESILQRAGAERSYFQGRNMQRGMAAYEQVESWKGRKTRLDDYDRLQLNMRKMAETTRNALSAMERAGDTKSVDYQRTAAEYNMYQSAAADFQDKMVAEMTRIPYSLMAGDLFNSKSSGVAAGFFSTGGVAADVKVENINKSILESIKQSNKLLEILANNMHKNDSSIVPGVYRRYLDARTVRYTM